MATVRERVEYGPRTQARPDLRDLPLTELLRRLATDVSTLVRQEIQLARAELTEKAKYSAVGIGELGGAALLALFAFGALTAAFIAALALALPVWLSAFIVFVVYAVIAGILAMLGRNQLSRGMPPVPQQTVDTVKEDIQWVKTQPRSERTFNRPAGA